jgi:hypothetical protein
MTVGHPTVLNLDDVTMYSPGSLVSSATKTRQRVGQANGDDAQACMDTCLGVLTADLA